MTINSETGIDIDTPLEDGQQEAFFECLAVELVHSGEGPQNKISEFMLELRTHFMDTPITCRTIFHAEDDPIVTFPGDRFNTLTAMLRAYAAACGQPRIFDAA